MTVRELLNKQNPMITSGIVAVAILAMVALAFVGNSRGDGVSTPKAFFSIDDGNTWFVDDARKVAPFQHNGKDANRAYVFKCADGKEFVAFLERYTAAAKAAQEGANVRWGRASTPILDEGSSIEIKVPKRPVWLKRGSPAAATLLKPKCPRGGTAQAVYP